MRRWAMLSLIALAIAGVHWFVVLLAFFGGLAGEIGGHPPWWAVLLGRVWFPLGFPATVIIGSLTPGLLELSNLSTLAITAASSLLWGVSITALWVSLRHRMRR